MVKYLIENLPTDLDDSYQPRFLSLVDKCTNKDLKNISLIIIHYYFQNNSAKKNMKLPYGVKAMYKGSIYLVDLNLLPLALRKLLYGYVYYLFEQ